ncbi:DNA polymerase III subunit gamma/tau, partial [bacterium]|nr:DNA polymerase III subunit gamma/tau [bacterium]
MASKYTVSALKHRPQRFSEVLAQDHVTRTLKHSLERGQIANAYLFAGSRGTGKTTTARLLAKALNCENPSEAEPCNECQNCVAINSGTFIDVLEIDAASNRGIDEIRGLRDIVRFSPTQGKYKVYIIDEVHMLTKEAYNAFLKTLEEPPSHSRFIMATTELQKVPNTILSRCQRFQFRRIPIQIIIEHLKRILDQQTDLEFAEPEEMDRIFYHIARASEGGLRDALVSMDQLLAFCSGKLNLAEVEEILGVIEFDLQNRFVSAIIQHDLNNILAIIEELSNRGNDMEWFLKECLQFMRNLAVSKIAKDTRNLIDMPDEYRAQIKNTADQTTLEQILYMTDILWEADFRMKNSHNTRLILEMAAFKAAKAGQAIKVEDILNRLSSGTLSFDTPQQKQVPQPAPTQTNPAPAQSPPTQQEEISHNTPTPQ